MKKILMFFAALAITVMASAQTKNLEYGGPLGMPYVSLYGGAVAPMNVENFSDALKATLPEAGIELGTYVTPVWGASVEGAAVFNLPPYERQTILNRHYVLGNGKMNLSNFLAGYKGYPRRVEFVLVAGAGWERDYTKLVPNAEPEGTGEWIRTKADGDAPVEGDVTTGPLATYTTADQMVYNTAAEININLGETRTWQINIRPGVVWGHPRGGLGFHKENATARLNLGVTYKFGNRKTKSHNFVTNDYAVTQYDYDVLAARYDECSKREPEKVEVPVEVLREVEVVRTIEVSPNVKTVLTFPIGSAKLNKVEYAKLGVLARSILQTEKVYIVGSADTKTGSRDFNAQLAQERTAAVRKALIEDFGIAAERIITDWDFDTNELPEASRAAIISLYTDSASGE